MTTKTKMKHPVEFGSWLLMAGLCVLQIVWYIFTGHYVAKFTVNSAVFLIMLEGAWLFGHRAWHAKRGENLRSQNDD